jgi:hypothetical protein
MIRAAFLGVDIGQASDPSAWTLCERKIYARDKRLLNRRIDEMETYSNLHATAFSRFALRTPYTNVLKTLASIVAIPELYRDIALIIDCTRERAVYEMIRLSPDFHGITIIPIVITSGNHVSTDEYGWYNVPEAELLSALTVALEGQRLIIDKGGQELGDEERLNEQLTHIKRKTSAKRKSIGMTVDGTDVDHDDMAFSLALSVWYARYVGAFEGPRVHNRDEVKPYDPARAGLAI